jgi:hypothetical protein
VGDAACRNPRVVDADHLALLGKAAPKHRVSTGRLQVDLQHRKPRQDCLDKGAALDADGWIGCTLGAMQKFACASATVIVTGRSLTINNQQLTIDHQLLFARIASSTSLLASKSGSLR